MGIGLASTNVTYLALKTNAFSAIMQRNGHLSSSIIVLIICDFLIVNNTQGQRHNFHSVGINITASEASRKNLGLYLHT